MNFLFEKTKVEYNLKKLKQEHQIDFEYKPNKDIQMQTRLSSLKNKLDILEKKIYIEQFVAQERNKKNTKQAEYKVDNDYDFIKIKTVRFPNTRSRLIKKAKDKDKQSHKYNSLNSLYLLPQSNMKHKRYLIKNSSSSIINGSNRDNEFYLYKNRNNSSVEESINNCIFNINDYGNNANKIISNNSLINLSSNRTINSEKSKIKKKLEEYHKLIDMKLNLLKNKKHYEIDNIKNSFNKFKLCNVDKKHILYNNYKNMSSNFEKIKRKVLSISNKSYRCVNNYKKNKNS